MAWPYQSGTASKVVQAAMAWEEFHAGMGAFTVFDLELRQAIAEHRAELAIYQGMPRPPLPCGCPDKKMIMVQHERGCRDANVGDDW